MSCSSIWGGILQQERSKLADAGNLCLSATNLFFSPPEASNLQLYSGKAEIFCLAFNLHSTSQRLSRKCSDSLNRHLSPLCGCEVVLPTHLSLLTNISEDCYYIRAQNFSFYLLSGTTDREQTVPFVETHLWVFNRYIWEGGDVLLTFC